MYSSSAVCASVVVTVCKSVVSSSGTTTSADQKVVNLPR